MLVVGAAKVVTFYRVPGFVLPQRGFPLHGLARRAAPVGRCCDVEQYDPKPRFREGLAASWLDSLYVISILSCMSMLLCCLALVARLRLCGILFSLRNYLCVCDAGTRRGRLPLQRSVASSYRLELETTMLLVAIVATVVISYLQ